MNATTATSLIASVITSITTLTGIWLSEKIRAGKKPDLADPDFEDLLKPVLDIIQEESQANRVFFWEGKNGSNTLSGYHIKTLNMMVESNAQGVQNIRSELQDVPADTFKRNMKKLAMVDDYMVSYEHLENDELAYLYQGYGIETLIAFKIRTKFDKWTGLLMVSFDKHREFSEIELSWLKTQAGRISAILKK
ncbi:MAG TPA: hypothetical protein VGM30_10345 [Puia sp.]